MFDSGIYRVFAVIQTGGKPVERPIARFYIEKKVFHILEDYDHLFTDSVPEGPMDEGHEKILWNLTHSGYYRVVHESEVNAGHHEDLVEEMDLGQKEPDAEYLLSGHSPEPQIMEMYQETAILDGRKLTEEELAEIIGKARSGAYKMTPL